MFEEQIKLGRYKNKHDSATTWPVSHFKVIQKKEDYYLEKLWRN